MGKMTADGGRFMVGGRGRLPLRTLARRGVTGPGLPERVPPFPDAGLPSDLLLFYYY